MSDQFRETRKAAGFSRIDAAEFLGVSLRTIGAWETGKARPAYAAFRLLRVMRNGDLVDPAWSGFSLIRGKLVTPENHTFEPGDLAWLSLLVQRARAFSRLRELRDAATGARAPGPVRAGVQGRASGGVALAASSGQRLWSKGGFADLAEGRISQVADSWGNPQILPSSNRGVSETERLAGEAVEAAQKRAATLPQAGVAARVGGAA